MTVEPVAQWDEIDGHLLSENPLLAIKKYREVTQVSLNAAIDAVAQRQLAIKHRFPDEATRFRDQRDEALRRLKKIPSEIIVIEASWDGDSTGWFIRLAAITAAPSQQHKVYTEHGLCALGSSSDGAKIIAGKLFLPMLVERATELGTGLATTTGVDYYLTSSYVDDTKRWWDQQSIPQHMVKCLTAGLDWDDSWHEA